MAQGASKGAAPPRRGEDGFFHPASEEELVALIVMASEKQSCCRVRGSAHSVSHVIYADPLWEIPNEANRQGPTPGESIEIKLDLYRGFRIKHPSDPSQKIVEVDAGIHLGVDPSDPTGTWENSLLYHLDLHGWMLSNLGGITHQTVSGFTATGSSGGSVKYSLNDDIRGFRVIDARGKVDEISRDDPDPARRDLFHAMVPNLGLLGVISTITLECKETYNIAGQESITTVADCAIDLFGPGTDKKPSLERFLREVDYGRLLWWPQRGVEKIEVWQAQRIEPQPGFKPHRYEEFTNYPGLTEVAASLIYTVLGNLGNLSRTGAQFDRTFDRAQQLLEKSSTIKKLGPLGKPLAKLISDGGQRGAECAVCALKPWAGPIDCAIPQFFPTLLGVFVPLDADKPGDEKDEPQSFHDYAWQGLPMDNELEDEILPTGFTEMWVPLGRTEEVMGMLRDYFQQPASARESYRRTGLYGWELYAAKPTEFWMNAAHAGGDDGEWQDGVFRVDPYWFAANAGDPTETFYPQFWNLLREKEVPFRLHWGKYQPDYEHGDTTWVNFFRARYPRWDAFLRLRAQRDPDEIFLTSYWRDRFGL